jgi:hypothetical protein
MKTAKKSWATVRIDGITRIDRVAGVFEIWPRDSDFPFAKFKVKVLERGGGDFLGVPNLAVRNADTGEPEYTSGLGKTVEAALADAVKYFLRSVKQHNPAAGLSEADFVWSACEDF